MDLAAGLLRQFRTRALQRFRIASTDHDPHTFFEELPRGFTSDATARAGHNSNLALDAEIHLVSSGFSGGYVLRRGIVMVGCLPGLPMHCNAGFGPARQAASGGAGFAQQWLRRTTMRNADMNIGFTGLGQMGRNMASRLLERGYTLTVWNRSAEPAEDCRRRGATVAASPAALSACDVVITMLADDAAVEAVWIDSGLLQQMPATTLHLNMASLSLAMGRRLAALHAAAGTPYVAAPVFGRPEAAAGGQLDIIAAGAASSLARCIPLFEILGRRWFNVGSDPACANIVKIARNFLLGSII